MFRQLPILDVWTSHNFSAYHVFWGNHVLMELRGHLGIVQGYNFCAIHDADVEKDGPVIKVTPTATPEAYVGTNKWLYISALVEGYFEYRFDGERWFIRVYPSENISIFHHRWSMTGHFAAKLPPYPSNLSPSGEIGIIDTNAVQHSSDNHYYIVYRNGYTDFHLPFGSWQPTTPVVSVEPSGSQTIARTTESPYDPRFRSTMVWGQKSTLDLYAGMVPASDIWQYRAVQEDWAAMSGREAGEATGSTLEFLWPWLVAAEPQQRTNVPCSEYIHRPAVIITDDRLLGTENAYISFEPDSWTNNKERVIQSGIDDSAYRHVQLDPATSLSSVLDASEGQNRRYNVRIPFIDVTPESYHDPHRSYPVMGRVKSDPTLYTGGGGVY